MAKAFRKVCVVNVPDYFSSCVSLFLEENSRKGDERGGLDLGPPGKSFSRSSSMKGSG